jgi:hypothetical protein
MGNMMTIKEASEMWGISTRRILKLCTEGRISGAVKESKWLIPTDATKPKDKRVKTGAFIKDKRTENLPLPIGISDYRKAVTDYYYVDKTLMIKEFLDERAQVSLFTRPRRFGKTLNMDMLKTFFEISEEDTSAYFINKKIWNCGQKYRDYQGKYPVIFISFKDIKHKTWNDSLRNIASVLAGEFLRHRELSQSTKVNEFDKAYYQKVAAQKADEVELGQSLLILSRMLDEHYGIAPIIIIDEYDTPIQQGYTVGFYEQSVLFMRNFFSGGLKDNPHLSYGFMTGILRVAKESIFSGLNNLKINSVMDQKYSEYFGFTSDEVEEMAAYYGMSDKYAEICEWYDGYRFGNTDIFNPWSVSYYFANGCEPRAFWLATGSNGIIGEMLKTVDEDSYNSLQSLLQGQSVTAYIDTNVIYPQIKDHPSSVFSFLLVAGYLKVIKTEVAFVGDYMCELAIPNREISFVYKKEILERMSQMIPHGVAVDVHTALYSGNSEKLKASLEKLLLQSVSYYDVAKESFYHGFVLGLCAVMDNRYEITSNRESGDGRFDICLKPRVSHLPGILIELKAADNQNGLKGLAKEAVKQIESKRYSVSLEEAGITSVLKYGVAFFGKYVEVELG